MSKLKDEIVRACGELGLHVDTDFYIDFGDGHKLHAIARIRDVGAVNGMLVVSEYGNIKGYIDELLEAGYGYSVLSEPQANAEFDLDSYGEMFSDWGWSGVGAKRPSWFK